MSATLEITWGERLMVIAHRANRTGLNPVVLRIQDVVGRRVGVRNSFSKLYEFANVNDLKDADRERAWYLLAALGEDPSHWGIYDDALPPLAAGQIEQLKEKLCTPSDLNREPTD